VVIWPEGAAIAFAALALLPAGYWALVTVIIGFYFGGPHAAQSAGLPKICAISCKQSSRGHRQYQTPPLRPSLPVKAADDSPELALELAQGLPQAENAAVRDWAQEKG
jgi:hypothetical protein